THTLTIGFPCGALVYARQKRRGYRRGPILAALLAESSLQGLLGGLLGAGSAYAILEALRAAGKTGYSSILGPLGGFRMSPGVAAEGVAVALVVGIVAGLVPASTGARPNVSEALRPRVRRVWTGRDSG